MLFKKSVMTAAVFAIGSFAAMSANAETSTGTFDVELEVTKTCTVNSLTGTHKVDFTAYAAGATVQEATSSSAISVNCSNTTPYNIGLLGSGFLAIDGSATNKVAYSLLKAAGGTAWGNTGTEDVPGIGRGMATAQTNTHPIHVSLEAGATNNLVPGDYKDTITVNVSY